MALLYCIKQYNILLLRFRQTKQFESIIVYEAVITKSYSFDT